MARFTNPRDLAAHQRARAARVKRSLTIEFGSLIEQARADAVTLTSGSVSTEALAQMGHPFGRSAARTGRPGRMRGSLPRLPINLQTGELQRSLRLFRRFDSRGLTYSLQFTSPHAVVLSPGGTSRMVARGFWAEMHKRHKGRAFRRLERALRLAHKSG